MCGEVTVFSNLSKQPLKMCGDGGVADRFVRWTRVLPALTLRYSAEKEHIACKGRTTATEILTYRPKRACIIAGCNVHPPAITIDIGFGFFHEDTEVAFFELNVVPLEHYYLAESKKAAEPEDHEGQRTKVLQGVRSNHRFVV